MLKMCPPFFRWRTHSSFSRTSITLSGPFLDFIVDPARCTNARFHVCPSNQHAKLLVGCLELMNQRLEQNMCKLPDGVANLEVNDLKERTE